MLRTIRSPARGDYPVLAIETLLALENRKRWVPRLVSIQEQEVECPWCENGP